MREIMGARENEFDILYHVRLDQVLPPRSKNEEPEKLKDNRHSHFIDLAILRKTHSHPGQLASVALIDIDRPQEEKNAAKLMRLETLGVPYFCIRGGDDARDGCASLADRLSDLESALFVPDEQLHFFRAHNLQAHTSVLLNQLLNPDGLIYLNEVKFSEVLWVSPRLREDMTASIRKENKARPENQRISSKLVDVLDFDGVVATAPPFSVPLFFVEIDGAMHRNDSGKRWKDKIKNDLCLMAGAAVIRISVGGDIDRRDQKNALDLLGPVAQRLSRDIRQGDPRYMSVLLEMLNAEISALDGHRRTDMGVLARHIEDLHADTVQSISQSTDFNSSGDVVEERDTFDDDQARFEEELGDSLYCEMIENHDISQLFSYSVRAQVTEAGTTAFCNVYAPPWWAPHLSRLGLEFPDPPLVQFPAFSFYGTSDLKLSVEGSVEQLFGPNIEKKIRSEVVRVLGPQWAAVVSKINEDAHRKIEKALQRDLQRCGGNTDLLTKRLYHGLGVPSVITVSIHRGETEAGQRAWYESTIKGRALESAKVLERTQGIGSELAAEVLADVERRWRHSLSVAPVRKYWSSEDELLAARGALRRRPVP